MRLSVNDVESLSMSLAQQVRIPRLGWTGHALRHNDLTAHDGRVNVKYTASSSRHVSSLADVADDVAYVVSAPLPTRTCQFVIAAEDRRVFNVRPPSW